MSTALLAQQIAATCDMISDAVGYLDRAIADQGFIADGSYSDLRLTSYAKRLREMADAIDVRRAALLANETVPFLEAAE